MANKIQKQKGVLIGVSVAGILLGLGGVIGGIILCVNQIKAMIDAVTNNTSFVGNIFGALGGIVLVLVGLVLLAWGIRTVWIGGALKATKGSVADPSVVSGTVNGKKCPKCGCTNTPDQTKCTSCGADL